MTQLPPKSGLKKLFLILMWINLIVPFIVLYIKFRTQGPNSGALTFSDYIFYHSPIHFYVLYLMGVINLVFFVLFVNGNSGFKGPGKKNAVFVGTIALIIGFFPIVFLVGGIMYFIASGGIHTQ